jgi:hypothetical protein
MNLKFCPLFLSGRRSRYLNGCRQILALGLVLAVFLTTLVSSVSAYAPADTASDYDHFMIFVDENGDTVCREATALEARELDQIRPTDLRPINHLDRIVSKGGGIGAEDHLPGNLTIVLRATAALEANTAAKAAFIRAARAWETRISSPVTLYIDADFGPNFFGSPWENGTLGATSSPSLNSVNYATVRQTLLAGANTAAKQAVYNALPASSIPVDAGTGSSTNVSISHSIARALGLLNPTAQPTDGAARIGFNSAVTFDFDSSNGVIGRDFESVAIHEIGHALGFTSRAGSGSSTPAMWDLYRFRSGTTSATFTTAQRIMTIGGPTTNSQYYFVPGITEIGLSDGGPNPPEEPPFPNNSDGNQSSHWRQAILNGGYIGIMDPRLPQNITRPITANDTEALNIFGYNSNVVVPNPPPNDNFANAQVITGCSGSVTGTNVGATRESGEPNHLSTVDNGGGARSIWYQWQAPTSGSVTFNTSGSGFDTVMGVYIGGGVSSLSVVAQHDDVVPGTTRTSSITFNASAGTTYRIAVDGYNNGGSGGDVGPVTLNWSASNCSSENPIDGIPFFVTQQYLDFLGRSPDATGFANWTSTLNGCPNGGFGEFDNPHCDRVHVSAGFFLSVEFQGRGYFAYRFYEVALDRRPTYAEFVPDMALVGGSQSPQSEVVSKAAYTDAWMQRSEFRSRYDSLTNAAYVNALEANAEVTVSNKQSLIDALTNGSMNRGQVLRNIVESQAVANRFFNRAFVSMQYFGYLRRDPDTVGFQNWVNTLDADPSNFRHMIFGFLFSTEYRRRFGP